MTGPGLVELLLRDRQERSSTLGWSASAAGVVLILSAVAALAMSVTAPGEALGEGEVPMLVIIAPPTPAIGAVSEPAPQVDAAGPDTPQPVAEAEPAPVLPQAMSDPVVRPELAEMARPVPEAAPAADLALPEPPKEPEPEPRPEKKVEKTHERKAEDKPKEKPKEKQTARAGADAALPAPEKKAAASAGSGRKAAANYGAEVMKKIRKTRKKASPAKGVVVVGFRIAGDGGLAGVSVIQSSGNVALDKVAVDHLRRSAPFPPPPEGAGRNYSFEFVGR
ncbi:MAG: TonB family protein [Anaerolineae bacterium]|nr:TonB family protein [Anaerolineae bacterium]